MEKEYAPQFVSSARDVISFRKKKEKTSGPFGHVQHVEGINWLIKIAWVKVIRN